MEEAKLLFVEVLQSSREVLGDTHSDTLRCINNLAILLTVQERCGSDHVFASRSRSVSRNCREYISLGETRIRAGSRRQNCATTMHQARCSPTTGLCFSMRSFLDNNSWPNGSNCSVASHRRGRDVGAGTAHLWICAWPSFKMNIPKLRSLHGLSSCRDCDQR